MKTLRGKLLSMWLMVTIIPLTLTLWLGHRLIDRSLSFAPIVELDRVSAHMRAAAREHYQAQSIALQQDIDRSKVQPQQYKLGARARWPEHVAEFWASGETQRIRLTGSKVNQLELAKKIPGGVAVYRRELKLSLTEIEREYAAARKRVEQAHSGDVRRGSTTLFLLLASLPWFASLGVLIWAVRRMSRPIQHLTKGLRQVGSGVQNVRLSPSGPEEVSQAMEAFNGMAAELESSRERLLYLTRIESWQALARKMAHEVKNSLTPIRLTMEEIVSRKGAPDGAFLEQAAQIVADEVNTLEKRVRAFSDFAAEPPVMPSEIDVNALIEERIAFLKAAHPEVVYEMSLAPERPQAMADPDLVKGVLTNLLENAAQAARPGGVVRARTIANGSLMSIEVHDSGPGLSAQARATLFEPTISFKKGGMGLGLSIAHRSALLCGGDIQMFDGELGGAGFRVLLPSGKHANGG
jgi:two-component system nitrogen regulation sensor histidine kinase NtrY